MYTYTYMDGITINFKMSLIRLPERGIYRKVSMEKREMGNDVIML